MGVRGPEDGLRMTESEPGAGLVGRRGAYEEITVGKDRVGALGSSMGKISRAGGKPSWKALDRGRGGESRQISTAQGLARVSKKRKGQRKEWFPPSTCLDEPPRYKTQENWSSKGATSTGAQHRPTGVGKSLKRWLLPLKIRAEK